jgi:two-component system cell cycle sensor histidine kinase/response regulator CckA
LNREHIVAVLYDMAMVVGGEVELRPLLTRTLQRLLYHTSFPVGLLLLGPSREIGEEVEARLELAIGDHHLAERAGRPLALPAKLYSGAAAFEEDPALLAGLPNTPRRYTTYLRLPIAGQGVILLLAPSTPHAELQLPMVFQPVMANLARAIVLCRDHEARAAGLLAQRDAALLERAEIAETLRATGEAAFDGIVVADADGTITYANPATARTFGYTIAEMVGRDVHALFAPERCREEAQAALRRFRETGQGRGLDRIREVDGKRKDGSEVPLEVSLSTTTVKGRRIVVGILRDVSERRRIEEQLRRSRKLDALGQLAAGVAHDFNNLLVAINGYTDAAIADLPAGSPLRGDLEEVRAAGVRAAALARQLLAFGRKQVMKPVVLSLNVVVGDLEKMLRRTIGEQYELRLELSPDAGSVRADPSQVEQILVNLVVNARDAMPRGGRIVVETGNAELRDEDTRASADVRPGAYVFLSVSDGGCGIDEGTLAHIFEPFFTTKPAGRGSGLGLPTVYGIVKQSGGHVDVRSEVGKGTTFRVYLPYTPGEVRAASPRPETVQVGGTETILVAEDDEGVRAAARRSLESLGYTVLTAVDGEAALRLGESHTGPIHLLLTDVVMPGTDGVELAERLTALRGSVGVLYMSGFGGTSLARRGGLPPGARFIEKPFSTLELGQRVRETLGRHGGAGRAPGPAPREPAGARGRTRRPA